MTRKICCIATAVLAASVFHAKALEFEPWEGHPIDIHGAFSQGYIKTSDNNWFRSHTEDGTSQFREIMLNANIQLTDRLSAGAQFMSRDFLEFGNNEVVLDWANLDYAFNDAIGLRLGRIKLGVGFYGDVWDVDAARTSSFLPLSTYLVHFRDWFIAADGGQFYGTLSLGKAGSLAYQVFVGTQTLPYGESGPEFNVEKNGKTQVTSDLVTDRIYAGKVTWNTPVEGLLLSSTYMSYQDITFDLALGNGTLGSYEVEETANWIGGAQYNHNEWTVTAEICRMTTTDQSVKFDGVPPGPKTDSVLEGWNVEVERMWGERVTTAVGYGEFIGTGNGREDTYFAIKVDPLDYLTLKAEAHYLKGTAQFPPLSNPDLEETFGLFAFKATLFF